MSKTKSKSTSKPASKKLGIRLTEEVKAKLLREGKLTPEQAERIDPPDVGTEHQNLHPKHHKNPQLKKHRNWRLSPEVRQKLTAAWRGVERIANMMHGLDTLCMNTDEGGPLHEFSFAIAYLAEMGRKRCRGIAEQTPALRNNGTLTGASKEALGGLMAVIKPRKVSLPDGGKAELTIRNIHGKFVSVSIRHLSAGNEKTLLWAIGYIKTHYDPEVFWRTHRNFVLKVASAVGFSPD